MEQINVRIKVLRKIFYIYLGILLNVIVDKRVKNRNERTKMKIIEVDEDLYQYIAANTKSIGESASDILRRLLSLPTAPGNASQANNVTSVTNNETAVPAAQVEVTVVNEQKGQTAKNSSRKGADKSILINVLKRLDKVLVSDEFKNENKGVARFLMLLSALYRSNPEGFSQATEIVTGSKRVYFSLANEELEASGSHSKPKQIPETPYWVVTNNNSQRKALMLQGIMEYMQLPQDKIDEVTKFFVV